MFRSLKTLAGLSLLRLLHRSRIAAKRKMVFDEKQRTLIQV